MWIIQSTVKAVQFTAGYTFAEVISAEFSPVVTSFIPDVYNIESGQTDYDYTSQESHNHGYIEDDGGYYYTSSGSASGNSTAYGITGFSSSRGTSTSETRPGSFQIPSSVVLSDSTSFGTGDSLYNLEDGTVTTTSSGDTTIYDLTSETYASGTGTSSSRKTSVYLTRLATQTTYATTTGGPLSTTRQSQSSFTSRDQTVRDDYVVFADSEWVWVITQSDRFLTGIYELSDIADSLEETSYKYHDTYTTKSFQLVGSGTTNGRALKTVESTLTTTIFYFDFTKVTSTGLNSLLHPGIYDQLPSPRAETFITQIQSLRTESTSVVIGIGITTVSTQIAGNALSAVSVPVTLTTTATIDAPLFRTSGPVVILGLTNVVTTYTYSTYAESDVAFSAGTYQFTSTATATYVDLGTTFSVTDSTNRNEAQNLTTTTNTTCAQFSAQRGDWTVYEASFEPALRFTSSGKVDRIDGPADTWFYPFFSQVWKDLYLLMTYVQPRTARHFERYTTEVYPGQTYGVESGPEKILHYVWKTESGVTRIGITESWSDTYASTSTSRSTIFTPASAGENDDTILVVRQKAYGQNSFAVGGKQWGGRPAVVQLGAGIWCMTTYDESGGSATEKKVVNSGILRLDIGTDSIVAFEGMLGFAANGEAPVIGFGASPFYTLQKYDNEAIVQPY